MDLIAVRNALAAQITAGTGLRAYGQALDSPVPPCAMVVPGSPAVTYGTTMPGPGAVSIGLAVLIVLSDAPLAQQTQQALDRLLSTDPEHAPDSVVLAVESDPTLGGTVEWCEPLTVTQYGRLEIGGLTVFGARLNLTAGTI